MAKRYAFVHTETCVACGACENVCPQNAARVWRGSMARIDESLCVGCGICAKECPAGAIDIRNRAEERFDGHCSPEHKARGACPMCGQLAASPYNDKMFS